LGFPISGGFVTGINLGGIYNPFPEDSFHNQALWQRMLDFDWKV